ncbi:hypothetical protein HanPI659440_Chr09g0321911 [Helianthus annuus]|nr:hypothetical protein HanPI659440_Chr09g0321911 [Helianthus annuus]
MAKYLYTLNNYQLIHLRHSSTYDKDIQVLTHNQDRRLVLKSFTRTEVSNKYKNICRSQHCSR